VRTPVLFLFLSVACEPSSLDDDKPPAEICDNLEDDDLDELADCADPDCAALCGEVCTNGTDDDLDGLIDCLDDDCDGLCPENCGDGRDNDADGAIDCDDRDCFGSCPEVCDDGFDNDGDGKVDCLDEECVDPSCAENCTDGRDNDADGLVDCADDDCNDPACAENCTDGRDNDADGRIDCDDADCDGDCPEICTDGRDNDADGRIDCDDDECAAECDADGDGFFNADYGGDDCDDSRADINPGRPEICNGEESLDDDCDGLFDEDDPDIDALTLTGWGRDDDADGYGTGRDLLFACQQPDGFGFANTDCDDSRADVNPAMPEICNPEGPVDDDCDGLVDDADPDVTEDSYLEWYADRDGDGFGAEDDFVYACSRPDGTAATNDDCDDADPSVGPPSLWYADGDRDGFGAGEPVDPVPSCDPPGPGLRPGWVGLDCDDGDASVNPDASEICEDGVDQDCDGRDTTCGFLISEWNASTVHEYEPTTGSITVVHTTRLNDVDCNAAEGSDLAWYAEHYDDTVGTFVLGDGVGEVPRVDTPYAYPKHVAVFAGEVIVVSRNDCLVKRYALDGAYLGDFSAGCSVGQGAATDGSHLFVSTWSPPGINEYDAGYRLVASHPFPSGMAGDNLVDLVYDARAGTWWGMDESGEGGTGTNTDVLVEFTMGGSVVRSVVMPVAIDGIGLNACP
jgi:hypothetical protein